MQINQLRRVNKDLLHKCACISGFRNAFNKYATQPKVLAELDSVLSAAIANEEVKPRRHPGVMKTKTCELSEKITSAILSTVRDQPLKTLIVEGQALTRYLLGRHPPMEGNELQTKITEIQQSLEAEFERKSSLSGEDQERVTQEFNRKVQERLKQKVYSWQPIVYTRYRAMQYLIGRSAAEFAVLVKIFSEIKLRTPDFHPKTLFDFGSGVGTVSWAANCLWRNSIKENVNVDSSADMNDLAGLILREGKEHEALPKGVFYRQFLPSSSQTKYELVVSAYSLLELPTAQSRLETVLNLWNKCHSYLVLVELGTNAGFNVINQARDFVLHLTESQQSVTAHVFSPCPHDLACPRHFKSRIPCNFEASYFPLSFASKRHEVCRERFSYVVLKKGARPVDDAQWPRLISPTLSRSKCAVCRMCHPHGQLEEVIFTASKHGKDTYRCAKASDWGDLLPIKIARCTGVNTEPKEEEQSSTEVKMEPKEEEQSSSGGKE